VAIDTKHLPDDPQTLQQMVLDLMAQLEREFTERSKVESLLRELLDAKRNRKSEQLSEEQLACSRHSGRHAKRNGKRGRPGLRVTTRTMTPRLAQAQRKTRSGPVAGSLCHDISNGSAFCTICRMRKGTAILASRICGLSVKSRVNATNTFRRN
jgi:hypothetical protein